MPPSPRFHVVVRFEGRIVEDRCVTAALSLGDGGDVVVPGLGDAAHVLQAGRLCAVLGLAATVIRGDAKDELPSEGVALAEGERAELRSLAHPGLEIAIERISTERVKLRDRFITLPARETIFSAAIAGCLATLLGGKVVIGALTEPEVEPERERTALELAMYEAPVIPVVRLASPPIVVPPEPAPLLPAGADVLADVASSPIATPSLLDEPGEQVAPLALPVPEAAPRKQRARRRPRAEPPTDTALIRLLEPGEETAMVSILGATADEGVVDLVDGGVEGGVPSAMVVAGTGLDVEAPQIPREVPSTVAVAIAEADTTAVATKVEAPPDPRASGFTLADAFAGDDALATGTGKLTAIISTSKGKLTCELFEQRTPRTVANFVGLARGTRQWLDVAGNRWRAKPLYDGVVFHRVVAGFVIQAGDPEGTGKGGPGYTFADEIDPELKHDGAGVLAMANRGKDTNGSQFYVTLGPAPHVDGRDTVFGKCDTATALRIGKVATQPQTDRPVEPVVIRGIEIVRAAEPEAVVSPMILIAPPAEPSAAPEDPPGEG